MTDLRARVKVWLAQPHAPPPTWLIKDLLAEVERLRSVIDRAMAVPDGPNTYDRLLDILDILEEGKRHDGHYRNGGADPLPPMRPAANAG